MFAFGNSSQFPSLVVWVDHIPTFRVSKTIQIENKNSQAIIVQCSLLSELKDILSKIKGEIPFGKFRIIMRRFELNFPSK